MQKLWIFPFLLYLKGIEIDSHPLWLQWVKYLEKMSLIYLILFFVFGVIPSVIYRRYFSWFRYFWWFRYFCLFLRLGLWLLVILTFVLSFIMIWKHCSIQLILWFWLALWSNRLFIGLRSCNPRLQFWGLLIW